MLFSLPFETLLWRSMQEIGNLFHISVLPDVSKQAQWLLTIPATIVKNWIDRLQYFIDGPKLISRQYGKNSKSPYIVSTPGSPLFLISSKLQIEELVKSPETQLSLHSIASDMFQPEYTMYGYVLHDQSNVNGSVHSRVLRTLLTQNIEHLIPSLHNILKTVLADQIENGRLLSCGSRALPIFPAAKLLVTQINSEMFGGPTLSKSIEYCEAAAQYPQDVFMTGEILQVTPRALAPLVALITTRNNRALKIMLKYLFPLVQDRQKNFQSGKQSGEQPLDCIQWILDSSPIKEKYDAEKIIQKALALWFGSVHQLAMTFVYALYDLCEHPEYIDQLRMELTQTDGKWWDCLDRLPLLDSFLKESARLNPSDSISIRRKVLNPYKFADGTFAPTGSWACVPQRAILRDPENYSAATTFEGFRFATGQAGTDSCSPFTKIDTPFPFWGMGKRSCPGRFYAVAILKMMVGHVLENYDIELTEPRKPKSFSWRSATIPLSSTKISFRDRVPKR